MAAPPTQTPRVGNSSRRHGIHGFLLVTTSDTGRAGGGDLPRRTALVPTPTRETVPVVHPFLVALRQQSRDVPSLGCEGALSRAKKRERRQPAVSSRRQSAVRAAAAPSPERPTAATVAGARAPRPTSRATAAAHQLRTERRKKGKGREGGKGGERTSAISTHAAVARAPQMVIVISSSACRSTCMAPLLYTYGCACSSKKSSPEAWTKGGYPYCSCALS